MKVGEVLKHWRWIAISIVLLVVVSFLISVLQQRATLRWIQGQGSGDYTTRQGFLISRIPPSTAKWLQDQLGDRWSAPFETVVGVTLLKPDLTANDVKRLRRFNKLEWLHLRATGATDEMLEPLSDFTEMNVLGLGETKVGDEGLEFLLHMPKLERLILNDTRVTDAGLVHLTECGQLRDLVLQSTTVTDEGLRYLLACRNLKFLNLADTGVSDEGMVQLKELPELILLVLDKTAVTDKGMVPLEELPKLEKLKISGTTVTDQGREWLRKSNPGLEITPEKAPKDTTLPPPAFPGGGF